MWGEGLHARPASKVVRLARSFKSSIHFKYKEQVVNARSILSILLLCASMGTTIQVEVTGEDEEQAIEAVRAMFESAEK